MPYSIPNASPSRPPPVGVHPRNQDLVLTADRVMVDAAQDLHRVPGPRRDGGLVHALVEPPGDPGVPQAVGLDHERPVKLLGGERGGPDFLPYLPPRGLLDRVTALGTE